MGNMTNDKRYHMILVIIIDWKGGEHVTASFGQWMGSAVAWGYWLLYWEGLACR